MKKNVFFTGASSLFLAIFCLVSCNMDEAAPETGSGNVVELRFAPQAPEADPTKVTFEGEKLVWVGDETMDVLIGNASSTEASKSMSVTLANDGNDVFAGKVDLGSFTESDIRAITVPGANGAWIRYEDESFRARIPVRMEQVQEKDGVMNGDNFPLYAVITDDIRNACRKADGSYSYEGIKLQWGCAAVRFNVYGTHPEMKADEVLESIEVKFDYFPQNFEVRLDNDEIIRNSDSQDIKVSLAEGATIAGKTADNGVKVFMAVFPYENNIRKITVKTDKATYVMTEAAEPVKAIAGTDLRGNVYQFGLNLSKFQRTDSRMLEYYKKEILKILRGANLPSMQVVYTKGDDICYSFVVVNEDFYASASADHQENAPITTESIYHACSIGKVPMAYVAMKLVEEGKLDLDRTVVSYYDDPVNNEVTAFFAEGESRQNVCEVTFRQLLLHLSGISNNFPWAGDIKDVKYTDSAVEQYRDKSYRYSTNGIHVLDLGLGQIIGQNLKDYENSYIFDKIGMKHSSYVWLDEYARTAVKGHHGSTYYLKNNWTIANAGLTLYTSAEEYTKFLRWILDGADFIGGTESEHYKAMFAKHGVPGWDSSDGTVWQGYIWRCYNQEGFGNIYMHSGSLGGFRGQMLIIPDSDETLMYLTNSTTTYNYKSPVAKLFLGTEVDALVNDSSHPDKIEVESDTTGDAGDFDIKFE